MTNIASAIPCSHSLILIDNNKIQALCDSAQIKLMISCIFLMWHRLFRRSHLLPSLKIGVSRRNLYEYINQSCAYRFTRRGHHDSHYSAAVVDDRRNLPNCDWPSRIVWGWSLLSMKYLYALKQAKLSSLA